MRSTMSVWSECGGKNFHFVHTSADIQSVVMGTIRSAFEYGGQKCSACSRMYVPDSLWPQIRQQLLDVHKSIKVGDPVEDFSTFFSAVIDDKSFARISRWLSHAKSSPNLTIIAGGNCDDRKGYFVEPTIIETKDPQDPIMNEEIFGPVLSVYVYPDKKYQEVLQLIDHTSPYALTGAVFAHDKNVIDEAAKVLRNAAGNYYVNDKSTGSIVAQQPFGGARASGTNDKPGGPHYVLEVDVSTGGEADACTPHRLEVPLHGLSSLSIHPSSSGFAPLCTDSDITVLLEM
ncbi:Delta-1-pyrroline-5-carboxylate dehydrogenase, mitochondrial [Oryzias melastigma]|uniref:Delta-1-pyrroline-5-carboxylate dehydrogenase, mitochondrial n=1 Tax=Oryzias melastigma TaxID=30732 RepID=A0A834CPV3_ORYME|nr:Delta-1-pyrroline-5-carboxylate dehydrogenase, mitochondrial [Oryzias melastigma]